MPLKQFSISKADSTCENVTVGVPLETLVDQGLNEDVAALLRNNAKITSMMAVQGAIISGYLDVVKQQEHYAILPDFYVSAGSPNEKTLAHAIVVVDSLVKVRARITTPPSPTGPSLSEQDSPAALAQAFETATICALVVCPTNSKVLEVFNIYKPLCEKMGISVSQFVTTRDHKILGNHLNNIKSSKATIAIGTLECMLNLTFKDIYDRETPKICETPQEARAMMARIIGASPRILEDTRVIIIEDSDEFLDERWTKAMRELTTDVAAALNPTCALFVFSQRPFEAQGNPFIRWLGSGESHIKRFVSD